MIDDSKMQLIGSASGLVEGGVGLRFDVNDQSGELIPAFVVRFDGGYFAYLNRCGHIAVQLDYQAGEFFSDDGRTLICATHGAEYAPDTGACLGGPCYGVGLDAIEIVCRDHYLYLVSERYRVVSSATTDSA
ncbi:Rieske (2Fe-2S) protein [Arenicella xantha]|uniref:Nitrite reductase/ring-hydroxylating ferredoxin subunit n=1 Tax=Arenicella xantha TaxID=644221 RepID=A0A395JL75_9GAMM|nr:Rieske 2Fe-2S domain-containing protein [Arenicella xantha]RBP51522.1 nitrite reductase/ring-hydroxylating ferredoxin subunit [Arenicella xantha]